MIEKIKECPFCGADVPVVQLIKEKNGNNWQYQIICNYNLGGCGASSCYEKEPEEAVKAWNRRVD